MMRKMSVIGFVVIFVACANIQMYEGANLPSSEVAIVTVGSPKLLSFDPELAILEINGKAVPRSIAWDAASYEVTPGIQTVKAQQYYPTGGFVSGEGAPRSISFDAEAGKTYVVFYRWLNREESDWVLFVEEGNSGTGVSQQ